MILVWHQLGGESLVDDMRTVDGGVFHEHLYLLAEQLSVAAPCYRVAIHRHAGVFGVVDEGVAHRLHIIAEGSHLVVAMRRAIHGVGVQMICYHLYGVGMHEECVLLRIFHHHGILRSEGETVFLVIPQVVAVEFVFLLRVFVYPWLMPRFSS